jgi:hypothetical protein
MTAESVDEALSLPLLNGTTSSAGQASREEPSKSPPEFSTSGAAERSTVLSQIPTIVYILMATIVFLIILFLSTAVFFPPSTTIPDESGWNKKTNHTAPPRENSQVLRDEEDSGPIGVDIISLTESAPEMNTQFATADVGKHVVEISEKGNTFETK